MESAKKIIEKEITENSVVVISCSGGPDSMCLLNLILEYKKLKNLTIVCAHVNHKVREESEEEEEFVKTFCEKNNIIFELLTINEYSGNFHNDARVLRYNFLDDICEKYESKILLTAHHGDDLVETILMRISRGSNLPGYAGFKVINKLSTLKVVRPLVTITKKDIIKFNEKNKIEYRVDKTNESLEYTRNKYRHLILPNLKKIDEKIHLKFLKFSEKLLEYDEFVKEYIENQKIVVDDYIDIKIYDSESDFIKRKSIELLIFKYQQNEQFYVTDNIIFEIEKLLNSDKGKATINLPNAHIGVKKNKQFNIEKIK